MEKVVIIGGGFAGINVVNQLSKSPEFLITLIDRNSYHFTSNLICRVATGRLEPSAASYPFRRILIGQYQVQFKMGEFIRLIADENKIILSTGEVIYDHLIFATGSNATAIENVNIRNNAIQLKSINNALSLKNHLFTKLEEATNTLDVRERTKLMTIIIAGGGLTGCEIAGMIAGLKRTTLPSEYPELTKYKYEFRVYIIEAGPVVLPFLSQFERDEAFWHLTKMGVVIRNNVRVTDCYPDKIILDSGEVIEGNTLIWATGLTGTIFQGIPESSYGEGKRLIVNSFNEVRGLKEVYAIGDSCIQRHDKNFPSGYPQSAKVAIRQGRNTAINLIRFKSNKERLPFSYIGNRNISVLSNNRMVADRLWKTLPFKNGIAFLLWVFEQLSIFVIYPAKMTAGVRYFFRLIK